MSISISSHRKPAVPPRSNITIGSRPPTPTLKLDVPLVGQRLSMECWYASACMVAYYREAGPRLGLPRAWAANHGVQPSALARLARAEGLKVLPRPSSSHQIDKFGLYRWLQDYGPLWACGSWYGVGHAIVITGIEGDTVHINDPDDQAGGDDGRRGTETVAWFNSHLWWEIPDCLLYRDA